MVETLKQMEKVCLQVKHIAVLSICSPITHQLARVNDPDLWNKRTVSASVASHDLPAFSFAPQEYITQVSAHSPYYIINYESQTVCVTKVKLLSPINVI